MAESANNLQRSDDRTRNPSTDFEPRDVNIRGLVLTGAVLGGVSLAAMLGLLLLFDHFSNRVGGTNEAMSRLAPERMPMPREPRLEALPAKGADRSLGMSAIEMQKTIEAAHAGYGWLDRDKQIVHVPIEDAMKMTLKTMAKPAPAPVAEKRTATEKQLEAQRTHPPGPSSSGRIITGDKE